MLPHGSYYVKNYKAATHLGQWLCFKSLLCCHTVPTIHDVQFQPDVLYLHTYIKNQNSEDSTFLLFLRMLDGQYNAG